MKLLIIAVTTIIMTFNLFSAQLKEVEIKGYGKITIDGILDDACWKNAAVLKGFTIFKEDKPTDITTAYITADSEWFYIGLVCKHPTPNDMKADASDGSPAIYLDESVELFIDPGSKGNLYFQMKLNCANASSEKSVGKTINATAIPWRSMTMKTSDGWTAEIAIPLYYLASYGNLEKLRINICRNYVTKEYDANSICVGAKRQLSSWAPVTSSFHEPHRFGKVNGLGNVKPRVPFVAIIEDVKVSNFQKTKNEMCYVLNMTVACPSKKTGIANITVIDSPISGKIEKIRKNIKLSGKAKEIFNIAIPVKSPVQRNINLELRNAEDGTFLHKTSVADTSSLKLLSAFMDKTYYTTEKYAYAIVQLGLPGKSLKSMKLHAKLNGKMVGYVSSPSPRTDLPVDLGKLSVGTHQIMVSLADSRNKEICNIKLAVIKRKPKPGFEWKVKKENGTLWHDGSPFFPYGLWLSIYINKQMQLNKACKMIAKTDMTSIMPLNYQSNPDDIPAEMKIVENNNLTVSPTVTGFANKRNLKSLEKYFKGKDLATLKKRNAGYMDLIRLKGDLCLRPEYKKISRKGRNEIYEEFYRKNLPDIINAVKKLKNYPSLFGYTSFDEPLYHAFDMYIQCEDLYKTINKIDGYHPVFMLYSSHIPELKQATTGCDFLGTDPYWIPTGSGIRGNINYVAKITYQTRKRALLDHKGTYVVLCAELWSGCHKRPLLPDEQYCQTYLAMIYGAKAIIYFRYPIVHIATWKALAKLSKQIKILAPSLLSEDLLQNIKYNPGGCNIEKNIFPAVHVRLFKNPDGGMILLAANTKKCPVKVKFTVSCILNNSYVERLFGKKRIKVNKNTFSDTFDPYGTRAYRIKTSISGKINLNVFMKPLSDKEIKESPEISRRGRKGRKNIIPNPSFESTSLQGWPCYYWPRIGLVNWPLTGQKNSTWSTDANNPYHGKKCLRFTKGNGFRIFCAPELTKVEPYTVSLYMKADRDGAKVSILLNGNITGSKGKIVKLTKNWKRYSFTADIPARLNKYFTIIVQQLRNDPDATIWVDALQFEKGTVATEFQE